jgi:outer membrane immunogenic protein
MKRFVVACVSVLALACASGPAAAADLPRYGAPPAAAAYYNPIYNWTGFYLGINGGGGWGTSRWDGVDTFDLSGGLIGGTVGYNWQVNQIVLGAEGDIDWSGIKGTSTNFLCVTGCETRNKWLVTARGRLGYAFDRVMPYVTGGLAAGDIHASRPGLPGGSNSSAGWTLGVGIEYGVLSNVSVKAEYLYVDLGNFNCGFNCGLAATGNTSFDANLLRGGLNVRF